MSEPIEVTMDDRILAGRAGQTLLKLAEENGIRIPTLCHHPLLPITGACRICLVEVKGAPRLEAACSTPIRRGMVVHTATERVQNARKTVLELLLASHKPHCLTCESNGRCELQDLAYEYRIEMDQLRFAIRESTHPIDDQNPAIIHDPGKCILCGRCVSACQLVRHENVIGFTERGSNLLVAAGMNQPLIDTACTFCGECVQVCPTGALTEKLPRFQGRWWELEKHTVVCPYCGVGCLLDAYVKDDAIMRIRGCEDAVVNQGSLCIKGRFGYDYANSHERLTTPLIHRNGKLEPASWDEALDLIATRFAELKREHGGDALAGLSSAKCTNEENYLFQKLVRTSFGTNNVDHCARLCHASTVAGLVRAFGSGAMTNSIHEIREADVILVTGSNTTENHPVIGMLIKQAVAGGAKLIVADPRRIELVDHATVWLRQRSGTDVALLNGLMHVILAENLHDKTFIEARCENFSAFSRLVYRYNPERVEGITGVPAMQIREAARLYATAERASLIFAMGITQHTTGVDNVLSTANLAMLTGNVGKPSTGVNPLRGQNNVQGACDLGALSNVYPGYQLVTDPAIRARFEEAWDIKLNGEVGLTVVEMMHAAHDGRLKGMYIMGENPMLSDPNLNHVREALQRLEFLVVQDIFLTETAAMADVVLPAASSYEKDGTFTNTERRIQRSTPAFPPVGDSRPDWKIICELSKRMGYHMPYASPAAIMEEIAMLTPIYAGVHYDRLGRDGVQWPCTSRDHPGTQYLHRDRFTRGRGHLSPVEYAPPAETPDGEYPFTLSTGRVLQHFHTGVMSRRAKVLDALMPEGYVEINPADAARLGLEEHDMVTVTSRRGTLTTRARITDRVDEGAIFMPFHFKEAAANLLTIDALDPVAKIPELKVAAVRMAKA